MKSLAAHKGLLIAVALFVLALVGYNYLAPDTSTTAPDLITQGAGKDIVSLYASLQSINFDQSLFASPGYQSLNDLSTPLPSIPLGRSNPFDTL